MFNKVLYFFVLWMSFNLLAQNVGLSPYSKTDLGDLNNDTGTRDSDMGFTGTGSYSPFALSTSNPAYLHNQVFPLIPARFTYYDFSVAAKAASFKSSAAKDGSFGGNFNRIAILVPINKNRKTMHKWGTLIVARPFSSINYDMNGSGAIVGDTLTYSYSNQGQGGLTEILWGNGVKISKSLSLGLNTSYVFGKYINDVSTKLENSSYSYANHTENRKTFFVFKPGISFVRNFKKIDSVFINEKFPDSGNTIKYVKKFKALDTVPTSYFINFGATYEYGINNQNTYFRTKKVFDNNLFESVFDTINQYSLPKYNLPGKANVGVSLVKLDEYFELPSQTYTIDLGYRQWELYNPSLGYRNTFNIGLGTEQKKLWGRKLLYFRFGGYFNQLPYKFNGQYIDEKGLTLGVTFKLPPPASQKNSPDKMLVNLNINLGQRGNMANNLIAEKFVKFTLGFTMIEDYWFRKYKLD